MRLGKASAYAVFAVAYIAEHADRGPVHGRDIAVANDIPLEYLAKILQRLARAHILASERGRNGGFRLRKPAREVTLLEIIEAIDGPLDGALAPDTASRSPQQARDALARVSGEISHYARVRLGETTVDRLIPPNRT